MTQKQGTKELRDQEFGRAACGDFLMHREKLWRVWKSGLMWRTEVEQLIEDREDGKALHNRYGVCTGEFAWGVNGVGKLGGVQGNEREFSNCPETHRRDLEKLPADYLQRSKGVG